MRRGSGGWERLSFQEHASESLGIHNAGLAKLCVVVRTDRLFAKVPDERPE
jgi:hypothetical protein